MYKVVQDIRKSDPTLKKRITKWVYRGTDPPELWAAARWMLVQRKDEVLRHIRTQQEDRLGHSIRHGAIRYLEQVGETSANIRCLTQHSLRQHEDEAGALTEFYFVTWAPPTAARSRTCLNMSKKLRDAVEC